MATKLDTKPARAAGLYERDFAAWSTAQAALLRAKRFTDLDLEPLIEEVEDLGRSQRDTVRSQVRRIIEHLLKLEHSPATDPRNAWKDTITDARSIVEDKLSPSLRLDLDSMLPRLFEQVSPKVTRALRRFGENQAADSLPSACPYTLDDICRPEWYPPNRHGIADATE